MVTYYGSKQQQSYRAVNHTHLIQFVSSCLLGYGAVGSTKLCIDLQTHVCECRGICLSQGPSHNALGTDPKNIITGTLHSR